MKSKTKSNVIRKYVHLQLRKRERGKTTTIFLSYTLNGTRRTENLKIVPIWDKAALKVAVAECEAVARKRDSELETGVVGAEHLHFRSKSFIEFYKLFMQSKGVVGECYRKSLLKFMEMLTAENRSDVTFAELDDNLCRRFRENLGSLIKRGTLSSTTAGKYFEVFKAVVNESLHRRLLAFNPCAGIKGFPKDTVERAFLTFEEIERLIQTPIPIPSTVYDYSQFADFFIFGCLTGARPSDVARLNWDNLRRQNGSDFIFYLPNKTKAKSTSLIVVPLHPHALEILARQRLKQIELKGTDLIFQGLPTGRSINTFNRFLKAWLLKAGIDKRITAYNSRHSFASNLVVQGVGLFEVSKLLGHSSLKHTTVYSHLTPESQRAAIAKLPMLNADVTKQ